jgi:hypothetical protein
MSEQQRARRRRQRQRRRQRRRDDAPLIEGEVVDEQDGEVADDDSGDEPDNRRRGGDDGGGSAPRRNTIFGMPRFMFTMTVGIFAALLFVIILQQVLGPATDDIDGVQRFPDLGRRHLAAGEVFDDYNSNPATSGPQNIEGVPSGIYGPDEEAPFDFIPASADLLPVLEAGGIAIHYRSDLVPEAGQLALRDLFARTLALNIVLTVNPTIETPIVAAAWGHLFALTELDDDFIDQLERFIAGEDEGFYRRFVLETDPVTRDLGTTTKLSPATDASDGE